MDTLIDIYVRDNIKLERQDSERDVRNDIKLHFTTFGETTLCNFTIKYWLLETTTKLLGFFETVFSIYSDAFPRSPEIRQRCS